MYLLELFEKAWPLIGMAAVTFWYAGKYLLFWNTCWHEAELEKKKAVGE